MEGSKKDCSFDEFLEDLKEAAIAYSRQPINTISSNTTSPPLYTSTTNTNTNTMMAYTMSKKEEEVMQQPWPELASYPPLGAWEDLLNTHSLHHHHQRAIDVDDYDDEAMKSSTYSDLILDLDMMLEKSRCFDNSSFFSSSSSSTLPTSISTFSTPPHHSSSISGIQLPTHSLSSFCNSSSPCQPPISIENKSQLVMHASSSSTSFSSPSSSLCHPPLCVGKKCLPSPVSVSSCSVVVEHEKYPKKGNQKEPKRDEKAKKDKDVPKFMIVTRSPQVDVLEDGFRWRKYGQKNLKNNIYPRSYYKCTIKTCKAQKRVERYSVDDELVFTTYHGIHSHPTSLRKSHLLLT